MALFYRADLFTKYGLTVPTTWAQFAADATKLHAEAPGVFLGSFSSVDPGEFAGLTQQAGAQWWSASGSTWTVGIDDAASQKVASFWQGLIAAGGVDNQPQWTAAWNKGMNDGKYIAWVSDVWAPGDFPTTAPSGTGKWVMTAAAAVDRGRERRGQLGRFLDRGDGRVKAPAGRRPVRRLAEHRPDGHRRAGVRRRHLPGGQRRRGRAVDARRRTSPTSRTSGPSRSSTRPRPRNVTWGPDVNVAYSEFSTAFGGAATSKGSFLTPLSAVQSAVLSDMKKSGFTVAAG